MQRLRMIEVAIADRYHEGKMRCPTHLSIGQELPSSILSVISSKTDFMVSGHRAHAHYLAKGGSLNALISELYGKERGCCLGVGGSMHLIDKSVNFSGSSAIVGNIIPVGVGLGYAARQKPDNAWTFICLGDGATEEGVFYESVNFAVLKNLNTIFFCENNFYSVYTGLSERQPSNRRLYQLGEAMGMRAKFLNYSQSLNEMRNFSHELKELMKEDGPIFVEIETFRHREHCGPNFDDDLGYRPPEQLEKYLKNDPLDTLTAKLQANVSTSDSMHRFTQKVAHEINTAFEIAEHSDSLDYNLLSEMEYAFVD